MKKAEEKGLKVNKKFFKSLFYETWFKLSEDERQKFRDGLINSK